MPNLIVSFMIFFLLQEVPEKTKESAGTPWQFVGLLPLFDPPRHDSAETIRRALNLGVNVKMITGRSHSSTSPLMLAFIFIVLSSLKIFSFPSIARGPACHCQGNWSEAWNGHKHVPLFFIAWPKQGCFHCSPPGR
jgi:hypothetical protein